MTNQRNIILAVVLSLVLMVGWPMLMERLYPTPDEPPVALPSGAPADAAAPAAVAEAATPAQTMAAALGSPQRVKIDAPQIEGSINLVGARVDDVEFRNHRATIDRDSGPVQFLAPQGTDQQHYARFDWEGTGTAVPGPAAVWTASSDELTPDSPVTLSWNNGQGQLFQLTFAIDDQFMITVEQSVSNTGTGPVALRPFALLSRTSATADPNTYNVHSGPIAQVGDSVDTDWKYEDLDEAPSGQVVLEGKPGWVGFTDIYWMSALIPEADARSQVSFQAAGDARYAARLFYDPVTVPVGRKITRSTRLFAGAKERPVLSAYEAQGVPLFDLAIDWGWFRFIVKPFYEVLVWLFGLTHNFGVAIICLTFLVRLLMFPVAQKQFASMAQMRAVQPKMKAIQERYKDDRAQLQQEMAKLYKEEKINPLAGCLPIFLQIPIFFALYKVLRLAIEMRHQPFFGWIHDLSAPDPLHILNLFGLLDFTPTSFLAIGPLAVLLGVTMWLQMRLNPAAMDPIQQQVFMLMPWMMMFVMAPFAAGLLIYWITSNLLTVAQQQYLYSRHPQLKAAKPATADTP